jgi:phenylacetic acid degradation operon negative regulatory protein
MPIGMKSDNILTMRGLNTTNPRSRAINGALKVLTVGAVLPIGLVAPNSLLLLEKMFGKRQKYSSRLLANMKYQKLVTVEETSQGLVVRATEKGKKRAIISDIDNLKIHVPMSWDGKWRMVMFDIPESRRSDRVFLAQKLSDLGFLMIQKSCWIHPFECRNEVGLIISITNLDRYVSLLTVVESNFDQFAKKYYIKAGLLNN